MVFRTIRIALDAMSKQRRLAMAKRDAVVPPFLGEGTVSVGKALRKV